MHSSQNWGVFLSHDASRPGSQVLHILPRSILKTHLSGQRFLTHKPIQGRGRNATIQRRTDMLRVSATSPDETPLNAIGQLV
jgi:hypothetical protein